MFQEVIVLNFLLITIRVQCQNNSFVIPKVTLEAYEPKGFRASIPVMDGIEMFGFHGNLNREIIRTEPGQLSQDATSPADKYLWSYVNDDLRLKVGDIIYFWIFVQHNQLGFLRDGQNWTVTELLKKEEANCPVSLSIVAKKPPPCQDSIIFEDNFSGPLLNTNKWLIEEYIPYYNSVDYEFVSYQNDPSVCYINNNKFFIRPKLAESEKEVLGELDLRKSCTRKDEEQCYFKRQGVFIVPPVTSARIVSLVNFRYGKIEVKAKLPAGDWIFPEIYLEQVSDPTKKLWIAYARGNKHLWTNNNEDVGNTLLFGGPVMQPREPVRSKYLKTIRNKYPFSNQMHTYSAIWAKNRILLHVDGVEYGEIDAKTMHEIKFSETDMVKLVLGVGVGGVNDFPDDLRSGTEEKPWRNKESAQVKKFFNEREKWTNTWVGDNIGLQVEFVRVTSI